VSPPPLPGRVGDVPQLLIVARPVLDVIREFEKQRARPLAATSAGKLLDTLALRQARGKLAWSRRDLVRAAGYLLDEIERLDLAALPEGGPGDPPSPSPSGAPPPPTG
jgi:hypothetical protein